jgi:DNA mismatch endonuclease, patch repair protein
VPRRRPYRPKTSVEIARNMSAIRSRDNKTEVALRKSLHAKGLRFRLFRKDLPGKPDLVFVSARVAVFVDGDFWHGRVLQEEGLSALVRTMRPKNRNYWKTKLVGNVRRDSITTSLLRRSGWVVLRFWESDVRKNVDGAAERIARVVRRRRPPSHQSA